MGRLGPAGGTRESGDGERENGEEEGKDGDAAEGQGRCQMIQVIKLVRRDSSLTLLLYFSGRLARCRG